MLKLFSLPLIAQVEQSGYQTFVDKIARTPQSTIVIFVGILTLFRIGAHLFPKYFVPRGSAPHKVLLFQHANKWIGNLNELLDAIIYAGVFVFLLVRPYLVQAFVVPSGSMIATLHVGDYILANKFIYRFTDPKEGDIVVFVPPKAAANSKELDAEGNVDVDFVKRCIGVPGDVIEIKNNVLYRNGVAVNEPYAHFFKLYDHMGNQFEQIPFSEDQRCPTDFKLVNYKGNVIPLNIEGELVNGDPEFSAPKYLVQDASTMNVLRTLPPAKIPDGYFLMMGDDRNNSFDGRAWGLVPRDRIVGRADYLWFPIPRIRHLIGNPGISQGK